MKSRRKFILSIIIIVVLVVFCYIPLKVRELDKEEAVSFAVSALLSGEKVWIDGKYQSFNDLRFIQETGRLYFQNDTEVDDEIFVSLGLKPKPEDRELDIDDGDAIVWCSYQDTEGKSTEMIQFCYVYGSLGGQGYEMKIYRNLFMAYTYFSHKWVL
ncbi:MAG: hypothetical protein GY869_31350 [Planctomycetes bacterium]|nr:hypothetical protein [Planctomycetota bacterium]